jgi:transcriptional regulator with XRE-family HTH domain
MSSCGCVSPQGEAFARRLRVELGDRLRFARWQKRMTQQAIAVELGRSRVWVNQAESGLTQIPVDLLIQWLDVVDLDAEQALTGLAKHKEV